MTARFQGQVADDLHTTLKPRLRAILEQLATAREHAVSLQADPWEFAVELAGLLAGGVWAADLRYLLVRGYIDLASETTKRGDRLRRFHPRRGIAFTARTCFVLTESGAACFNAGSGAAIDASAATTRLLRPEGGEKGEADGASGRPRWDAAGRVLWLAEHVVKRYRCASPNQEAVLAAFEEEQWPQRIDDPLRPVEGLDSKQRLRDTIRTLNAKQENPLIRFRSGGTGEHVIWEAVETQLVSPPARAGWRRAA